MDSLLIGLSLLGRAFMRFTEYTVTFLICLSCAYEARGSDCSLDGYDSTPPAALSGKIAQNGEDLAYSSDIERAKDRTFIWNYIQNNNEDRDVSVSWPEGSISYNIISPLPAGETACAVYVIDGKSEDHVDYDAVIKYGNANHEQRASAYIPDDDIKPKDKSVTSKVSFAYVSEVGKKSVNLDFSFRIEDKRLVDMKIAASDGFFVGIEGADRYWSSATKKSFFDIAKANKIQTEFSDWTKFAHDPQSMKAFLDQAKLDGGSALFANGSISGFGVGEMVSDTRQSGVVIFDSKRQPIFSTRIVLPVTGGQ